MRRSIMCAGAALVALVGTASAEPAKGTITFKSKSGPVVVEVKPRPEFDAWLAARKTTE